MSQGQTTHTDSSNNTPPNLAELHTAIIQPVVASGTDALRKRVYRGLTADNFLELFRSRSPALCDIAHSFVKNHAADTSVHKALTQFLRSPDAERQQLLAALKSLAAITLPKAHNLQDALIKVARSEDQLIAEHATRVISLRYPEDVSELLPEMRNPGTRRELCYSGQTKIIPALIKAWGVEHVRSSPPVALGMIMTPQALATLWREDPETGFAIARSFGYYDDRLDEPTHSEIQELCDLLDSGLSVADRSLLTPSADEARDLEASLMWALLPWATESHREPPSELSFESRRDLFTFLSAVRSLDRQNFSEAIDESPFREQHQKNPPLLEFSRGRISYLLRELVAKPSEEFAVMGGDTTQLARYLVENANCRLHRDFFLAAEQKMYLAARWAVAAQLRQTPEPITRFPPTDTRGPLNLSTLVVPQRAMTPAPRNLELPLSRGAEATLALLSHFGRADLASELSRVERSFVGVMPSIGIEIQRPLRPHEKHLLFAWKDALRSFGVPSPRRPEYHDLVEAACAPAHSYHAQIATVLLLRKLGFLGTEVDMALHISLSGELGPDVRYLLFAQQFIAAPTNQPLGQKLLSKGFAHLHSDAVSPHTHVTKSEPLSRTELRSMRMSAVETHTERFPSWIDTIIAFQLLGGALCSPNASLRSIWESFANNIRREAESLGAEFTRFLDADWYESSGDSSDKHLVPLLGIVSARDAVTRAIDERQLAATLRERFLTIRDQHARAIFHALPKSELYTARPDLFQTRAAGIPFFNPLGETRES